MRRPCCMSEPTHGIISCKSILTEGRRLHLAGESRLDNRRIDRVETSSRYRSIGLWLPGVCPNANQNPGFRPQLFLQGETTGRAPRWRAMKSTRQAASRSVAPRRPGRDRSMLDTNEIQSVPDATNAIERAISRDKVDFLIGGFRTEAVLAMQEVAMDNKKIFIGAGRRTAKLGPRTSSRTTTATSTGSASRRSRTWT